MSVGELDGWDLVATRGPRRGRRARLVPIVGVGLLVAGCVTWGLTGVLYDGPLDWQHAGHSTACTTDPLDRPGDVTMALGIGSLGPGRPDGVRLVGAHGISLVEADVAVVAPGPDGVYVVPPPAAGWPSLEGGTISPDSLVPAAAASVDPTSSHALVLRLHVDDPTVESGFEDIGIVYRTGLVRHERRLEYAQRFVPGAAACS